MTNPSKPLDARDRVGKPIVDREQPKPITARVEITPQIVRGICLFTECTFEVHRPHGNTRVDMEYVIADLRAHKKLHSDTHKGRLRVDLRSLNAAVIK
jgi:hypothetical protein